MFAENAWWCKGNSDKILNSSVGRREPFERNKEQTNCDNNWWGFDLKFNMSDASGRQNSKSRGLELYYSCYSKSLSSA